MEDVLQKRCNPTADRGRRRAASGSALFGNTGFGTLEVLVVLGLFAVVATGLTVVSIGAMKANSTSRDAAAAATLIYDKIEKLRALDPATNPADFLPGVHDDPLNPLSPLGQEGGRFERSWEVTGTTPRIGLAEVVVTVSWTDTTARSISGATYVCASSTCS
jgi:type II secretory pathway pseudopilin PulG